MMTDDDILDRLRIADPIRNAAPPELRLDAIADALTVVRLDDHRAGKRRRSLRLALTAGVAAVALLALPVIAPHFNTDPGSDRAALGPWLPNAAATELDALATKTRTTPLGDRYAYWSERQVNLAAHYTDPDAAPSRYWDNRTIQHWQGTNCNDRQTETWSAYRFLSPQEEAIWNAWAQGPGVAPQDRTDAAGGTRTWTGPELWDSPADGEPTNPCERGGSLDEPTPAYTASLPTEPAALLDRLVADNGRVKTPDDVASLLISVLSIPWLTSEQRATAIEAVGLLPQPWTVTDDAPVAGHPALRLSREIGGIRDDLVIVAAAPGVWERTSTITDPKAATEWSGGTYSGLPRGTVISSMTVTQSDIVADLSVTS